MTTTTAAPDRAATRAGHGRFSDLLHAEWTKFRTVRGWVIGMAVAALVTVLIGLLSAAGSHTSCNGGPCRFLYPVGPGGEAVTDSFYFVHQPLAGNGSITARVTSLTGLLPAASNGRVRAGQGPQSGMHPGLEPWSKAGIIIKASTRQGSAYAAMMVTGGHGVRMQYDYTQDVAGLPGAVTAASPRWLRLTRAGDTVTGYDSADGRHWTLVGTAVLPGLSSTVQAGLFATSPAYSVTTAQGLLGISGTGGPTLATGVLDHVGLHGGRSAGAWSGTAHRRRPQRRDPGPGRRVSPGRRRVHGDRDPATSRRTRPAARAPARPSTHTLVGAFAGLIAVVVVGTMFITAEYRRGLIRTTFAASPRRGRVLAAKAIVIGSVTFAAALVAAVVAVPLSSRVLRDNGNYLYPVTSLTEVRLVVGTAAMLAVAAVLALAIGAVLRRSAIAVTVVIVAIVLPFLISVTNLLPAGADQWLLRLAPAAAFSIQQTIPNYPQVRQRLLGGGWLLPARAMGRLRGAVRLGRGRAGAGGVPGAPEGRMSLASGAPRVLTRPAPATAAASLRDALHAEWTKLRTAPGTLGLLVAAVALTVAVSAAAAAATRCPAAGCGQDPAKVSLTGVYLGQVVVAVVAVLAISGEYSSGMIRTTLAAMPRRTTVLAAKAALVTGLTLAAGTLRRPGIAAGRAAHPARPWLHRGPRLRAAVPGRRAGAARRRRVGALPRPDRPAQPRHRHRRAGLRGSHRDRARPALPVPDRRRRGLRPVRAAPPPADRADDGRARHPGHHRPAQPAHQPLGRPRRPRRLGRRGAPGRRAAAPPAGRLSGARACPASSRPRSHKSPGEPVLAMGPGTGLCPPGRTRRLSARTARGSTRRRSRSPRAGRKASRSGTATSPPPRRAPRPPTTAR